MAGAFAALEAERFHEFEASGSTEVGGAAIAGGERGIAPEQMALGTRPDAIEHVRTLIGADALLIEIAVAVAGEVTRARGDGEGSGDAFARVLGGADVGLLVAEAEGLRPELGAGLDGHAGGAGYLDHLLVEPLGVHVDLDTAWFAVRSSRGGDS